MDDWRSNVEHNLDQMNIEHNLYHYGKENRTLTVSSVNTAQKTLKTAQVSNIVREPLY
jgi:hypothetical protein